MKRLNPFNLNRIGRYLCDIRQNAFAVSRAYGIPVAQIIREQLTLNQFNGMRRDEYYKYHLFDPALNMEQKKAFVSDAEVKGIQRQLNPPDYYNLFKNKLLFKRYFQDADIPTAALLGMFDPEWGWYARGTGAQSALRTADDLAGFIAEIPDDSGVVFKPIEGSEGQMVCVFPGKQQDDAGQEPLLVKVSGQTQSAEDLYCQLTNREALVRTYCGGAVKSAFLVEAYVKSHPRLATLCGAALSTCRLVSLVGRGGRVTLLGAVLKLAPPGAAVDNLHAGGLSVGIDLSTGILLKGRKMADMWRPYRDALENGVRFEGLELPYWTETCDLVKAAALAFPLLPCVGWDVAITDNGPLIIEGNWGWAADLMQIGMHQGIGTPLRDAINREQP